MFIPLAIFLVMTPILLLARHFTGWRLTHLLIADRLVEYESYQFGIKHLIILTTVAGLVMGLFRSICVIEANSSLRSIDEVIRISSEILLMIFPLLFLFWFSLVRFDKSGVSIAFAAVFLIILEIANFAFVPMMEKGLGTEMYRVIPFFQLGGGISVLLSAWVIRWCGFRMVRMS